MELAAGFAGVSAAELVLVAAVALFAAVVGGVAGYGTGVLMPLVLVPIAGAEAVVPIIAITALFNNASRATAFREVIDWRPVRTVVLAAAPTCVIGAYGFTLLNGRGALIVIGATLVSSVPLRRLMRRKGWTIGTRGLVTGAMVYGLLVGGTTGSGVLLIALLMATGLTGAAVIATDAIISLMLGVVKVSVFGIAGAVDGKVVAFALMIGVISLPGAFLAKALIDRLPLRFHTAILDAVILFGGFYMLASALLR
jgi:uncharacterized membrane protein YfcA